MSKNRIDKNYHLKGKEGRGSLWTIWLSPVEKGPNNIYFAGGGFLGKHRSKNGFEFHLSFHKNNNAHIKYKNDKIHRFNPVNTNNFFICSIYTHLGDLKVPLKISHKFSGQIVPIDVDELPNPKSYNWCELLFVHLEDNESLRFLESYKDKDYDLVPIDKIDIGQSRKILVFSRLIKSTTTIGDKPNPNNVYSKTNRLTVWGIKTNDKTHVTIHDLAADNLKRIDELYK